MLLERRHTRRVRIHTGTSGFSFDEWRGHFYPVNLSADARLAYYSARLASVEINNTFYQMPKAALLQRWRNAVPEEFRFALKAPRRITHVQKLRGVADSLASLSGVAAALGQKLGPILFQLPPFLQKDEALLADFLGALPPTWRVALEFRHVSWFQEGVFALLSEHNVALCSGDAEKGERSPPFVATADFGYLRLRAPSYDEATLLTWSQRILDRPWTDAYVYLKHEVLGPTYAQFLAAATSGGTQPAATVGTKRTATARRRTGAKLNSKVAPTRGRFVPE